MIATYAFMPDQTIQVLKTFDEFADVWSRREARVWVDLESPTEEDLLKLGQAFRLDEESLEDCLHGEHRPRVDEFDEYIVFVMYGLYGLKETDELEPHKLVAFCGSRFLLTVHRHPILSVRQVRARCARHPELVFSHGLDFALYVIMDLMVDHYVEIADRYEEQLEDLEEASFDDEIDDELLSEVAEVRRQLIELRRLANAQRQMLLPVAKGEFDFVSETLSQRFSHVRDHLGQVVETVDGLRESVVSIRDNYHAALMRRTNDIVTKLTIFAGIMLPLTLVAGIYGMNFPLWPNQNDASSFWIVLGTMLLLAFGLFSFFRRRKWLR